jgi:hypothetical protein
MTDAERKLWRAVLAQAHQDAEGTPLVDEIAQEPLVASRARHYLRADSEFDGANLAIVCEFADIPADRLILWARQRFAQAA